MSRWSRRGTAKKKKYRVKIRAMRLRTCSELDLLNDTTSNGKRVDNNVRELAVEVYWKGSRSAGFNLVVPFPRRSRHHKVRNVSNPAKAAVVVGNANDDVDHVDIQWDWEDDEFENICSFAVASSSSSTSSSSFKDDVSYEPCHVSFHFFLLSAGEDGIGELTTTAKGSGDKNRRRDVGKATVDLTEVMMLMLFNSSQEVEHMIPVDIQLDYPDAVPVPARQATLSMIMSFVEEPNSIFSSSLHSRSNSCDSIGVIHSDYSAEQQRAEGSSSSSVLRKAKSFGISTGKRKSSANNAKDKTSRTRSPQQAVINSDQEPPPLAVVALHDDSVTVPRHQGKSSETESSSLDYKKPKETGFWIWKRKGGDSFKRAKTTNNKDSQDEPFSSSTSLPECTYKKTAGVWHHKEDLTSRDGRSKLKSSVFFASFDQRSPEAAGESACTAIVAVFAHRLQQPNASAMPTGTEFDQLIVQGASDWRKLRDDDAWRADFPDSHFDLETVLKAEVRPLTVLQDRSHIGFFSPEKFKFLKEAKSFDDIWTEIDDHTSTDEYSVYIVSWNDHFFVLRIEAEACYIVDSLGERLYEGCSQAYILRFNQESVMYEKRTGEQEQQQQQGSSSVLKNQRDNNDGNSEVAEEDVGGEEQVVICKGRECCREYMKRFLAAIPVRELQEQEEKGTVSVFALHRQLQIEFHYSSSSSSSSSRPAAS